jgi:beta-lactamase regulating signal transducer with metallopeptidase domain
MVNLKNILKLIQEYVFPYGNWKYYIWFITTVIVWAYIAVSLPLLAGILIERNIISDSSISTSATLFSFAGYLMDVFVIWLFISVLIDIITLKYRLYKKYIKKEDL